MQNHITSLINIPDFSTLPETIAGQKNDLITRFLDSLPEVSKLIILTDIVNFSMRDSRRQIQDLFTFQRFLKSTTFKNRISFQKNIKIERFIPTGDGCYIIANECDPALVLDFLISLVSGIQTLNADTDEKIALRVSALIGKCIPFKDVAGNINFVGDGMNEATRLLSYGQSALENDFLKSQSASTENTSKIATSSKTLTKQDANKFSENSLFLGDSLANEAEKNKAKAIGFYKFQDVPDKHGITRNITVLQKVL